MSVRIVDNEWRLIETKSCQCEVDRYYNALEVWLTKPHVLNRRVCASEVIRRGFLPNTTFSEVINDFWTSDNKTLSSENSATDSHTSATARFECGVRKLFPRNRKIESSVEEIFIFDHSKTSIVFIPLDARSQNSAPNLHDIIRYQAYKLQLCENSLFLFVGQDYIAPSTLCFAKPSPDWLKNHLMPKLIKWATESNPNPGNHYTSLVAMDEYSQLYGNLKEKYAAKFVKLWTEVTDPLKFVYEDVAIATYILILWRQEREDCGITSKQSFIDLGCGNGLLVHILNCEGYRGKGVDVRKRKIWDVYGDETCLEETAITPSDSNLFAEYDWIIGNHSDELTPWIPVIASKSSFYTRYFVLPCCFHDFNCKFARTNSKQGQYRAYLDFVADIGRTCGFDVVEDRLRIPSTKRICQVGIKRTYKHEDQANINLKIKELIGKRSNLKKVTKTEDSHMQISHEIESVEHGTESDMYKKESDGTDFYKTDETVEIRESKRQCDATDNFCKKPKFVKPEVSSHQDGGNNVASKDSNNWIEGFTAREKVEPVRNCATVSLDIRKEIVSKVAFKLLEVAGVDDNETFDAGWRRGGHLNLSEVAGLVGSKMLKKLKQECGGLKTLLKNANQVFEVHGNIVHIRDWTKSQLSANQSIKKLQDKELLFKTKHCWFYDNHPDGCPRAIEICPFAHGPDDLRERPQFK